jgi:hypothetical protein
MAYEVHPATGVVTKGRYAQHRGCSAAYISKLIRRGALAAPALLSDGRVNVVLADQMLGSPGANEDREDSSAAAAGLTGESLTDQRRRKVAAEAELAELELARKRGELVPRALVAEVLGPLLRKLRDDLIGIPREVLDDGHQAERCEAAIVAVLERTSNGILALDGMAAPRASSSGG